MQSAHIIAAMPRGSKNLELKPFWLIAFGVVIGLAAAGLVLLLVTPRRGTPITLLSAPTQEAQVALSLANPSVEPTSAFPLNINTASAADLDLLPGVGPSLAQSIVAYRDSHGLFETLEQLQDVPGIGPRTFEAILPFIALEENQP